MLKTRHHAVLLKYIDIFIIVIVSMMEYVQRSIPF